MSGILSAIEEEPLTALQTCEIQAPQPHKPALTIVAMSP